MVEIAFITACVIGCQQFERILLMDFRKQVLQGLITETELAITNKSPQVRNSKAKRNNPTKLRKNQYIVTKYV
jgi:hypothetical protein